MCVLSVILTKNLIAFRRYNSKYYLESQDGIIVRFNRRLELKCTTLSSKKNSYTFFLYFWCYRRPLFPLNSSL